MKKILLFAILIYSTVSLIAQTTAAAPWEVTLSPGGTFVTESNPNFPLINGVNKRPNRIILQSYTQGTNIPGASLTGLHDMFNFYSNTGVNFNAGSLGNALINAQAGNNSSFKGVSFHSSDWKQNIQSLVNRGNSASYVVNFNGNDKFFVAGHGWVYANGGVYFGSDRKLKQNIMPLKNSLDRVDKLQGVSFKFKPEVLCPTCDSNTVIQSDEKIHIGFIAQEVETVVPEVVKDMPNGIKAINYAEITALLVEALKEMNVKVNLMSKQIEELEKKLKK